MSTTLIVCLTTFCISNPCVTTQKDDPAPAGRPVQVKTDKPQSSTPSKTDSPAAPQKAAPAEPKQVASGPQVHVVNRPIITPLKPEPKSDLLEIEQNIVDYTNTERARYGLPPLAVDPNLMTTARQHCTWMTLNRSMVHTNMAVAENIAMGQPSSQDVVRCWMNSSGHRANILNGGHRRIGVSAYRTPEGTIFWCQQFAP